METVTIQLPAVDYLRLKRAAAQTNKTIQAFIYDWIVQLPEFEGSFDVTQESVSQMEGHDSDVPHGEGPPIMSSDTPVELDGDYY